MVKSNPVPLSPFFVLNNFVRLLYDYKTRIRVLGIVCYSQDTFSRSCVTNNMFLESHKYEI